MARYSFPAAVGISVMSPTHCMFGASAVKSRFSRSGNFGAVLSCRVNPLRRLIRRATRPWRRIESATVFSDTTQPASRRSACSRGEPCSPRAVGERRRDRGVDLGAALLVSVCGPSAAAR